MLRVFSFVLGVSLVSSLAAPHVAAFEATHFCEVAGVMTPDRPVALPAPAAPWRVIFAVAHTPSVLSPETRLGLQVVAHPDVGALVAHVLRRPADRLGDPHVVASR